MCTFGDGLRCQDRAGATQQGRAEPLFIDFATGVWSAGFGESTRFHGDRNRWAAPHVGRDQGPRP